jgi:hypothetical protein
LTVLPNKFHKGYLKRQGDQKPVASRINKVDLQVITRHTTILANRPSKIVALFDAVV